MEKLRAQGEDLSRLTLLSDGRSIYAYYSPEEVVDVLRRGQGVFGLAVGPVSEEVRGRVASLRGRERTAAAAREEVAAAAGSSG